MPILVCSKAATGQIHRIGPLSGQQRTEILAKFSQISKHLNGDCYSKDARLIVENILNEKTPSWRFNHDSGHNTFYNLHESVPEALQGLRVETGQLIDAVLCGRGYRRGILTWQEHVLMGSTPMITPHELHTPLGIIEGKLTVQETQLARELEFFKNAYASFFGVQLRVRLYFSILLERLDEFGKTICDPRAFDAERLEKLVGKGAGYEEAVGSSLIMGLKKSDDFPARRSDQTTDPSTQVLF